MATVNIFDMADTWNAIGTTFNGIYMNFTDGAGGAPVGAAASRFFRLDSDGTSVFDVAASGDTSLASAAFLAWATDVKLFRDAAGILAQRNGVNAQEFRIYNTTDGVGNTEYLTFGWGGNVAFIGPRIAGTGTVRSMKVSGQTLVLQSGSLFTDRWVVDGSGHFVAAADNIYDIGASGATRPRTGYFGTSLVLGANTTILEDAADVLAQQRGTNSQITRGYRTFTNSTNYERWALQSGAGYFEWAAETAGTGTDDIDLRVTPAGTGKLDLRNIVSAAGTSVGTLNNAPTVGNPALWLRIKASGINYAIPCWATA